MLSNCKIQAKMSLIKYKIMFDTSLRIVNNTYTFLRYNLFCIPSSVFTRF